MLLWCLLLVNWNFYRSSSLLLLFNMVEQLGFIRPSFVLYILDTNLLSLWSRIVPILDVFECLE